MPAGRVYILSNPSFRDGLLKIGKTAGPAAVRAKGLRSTGVPAPFCVEFELAVPDCGLVESIVHRRLAKYRCTSEREFFEVSLDVAKATIEQVAREGQDPKTHASLEKEWRETVRSVGAIDREAAFSLRLERCSSVIASTFTALRDSVVGWPNVTTGIDSKIDGFTVYRQRGRSSPRRFFRMDPKHSATVDNMGVAFFGLTPDRIEEVSTIPVCRHLKQDGHWIFVHDSRSNDALLELAREAYDRLA